MNLTKVAAVLAALAMACGCLCGGPAQDQTTDTQGGTDQAVSTTVKAASTGQKPTATTAAAGGILSDLSAAISSGAGYKCTYIFDQYQSEMTVKGQMFASTNTAQGQVSHAVSDGTWMYTWVDGQGQGVKFNLRQMRQNAPVPGQGQSAPSIDDVKAGATQMQCTPSAVSDSSFQPPTDIQFQDMGEVPTQIQELQGGGQADAKAPKNIQQPRRRSGISG